MQNGATFYQSSYTDAAKYMTYRPRALAAVVGDARRQARRSASADHLEGELKLDAFYYRYADFAPLASRTGVNAGSA